jgi:alpha-L-fucosidase
LTGGFTDRKQKSFTAEDIRFTTKGNTLYAIALDWPGKAMIVKSFGGSSKMLEKSIESVSLVGSAH